MTLGTLVAGGKLSLLCADRGGDAEELCLRQPAPHDLAWQASAAPVCPAEWGNAAGLHNALDGVETRLASPPR